MTNISLETVASYQSEKRSWMLSQWGQGPGENPSIVLDVSAFTAGTHYPNGFFPSGLAVGKITATGLYGPYNNAASDGTEVCAGLLHSSVKVPNPAVTTIDTPAALVVAGFIKLGKLPISLDAPGQADLRLCHFVA